MKSLLGQFKMFVIFIMDLVLSYGALFLTVFLRYGRDNFRAEFDAHLVPFSFIILIFIVVFYIFNLYSFRFNKNITEFTNSFMKSLVISFTISVLIFYPFGNFFQLTPKINLVIFTAIFGVADFYLRIITKRYFTKKGIDRKIVIVSAERDSHIEELRRNQSFGFKIILEMPPELNLDEILPLHPDIVVLNDIDGKDFNKIYTLTINGISVYTINNFYEEIFQKVPTEKIEKDKVVDYLSKNKTVFNLTKRFLDIVLSFTLFILLSRHG